MLQLRRRLDLAEEALAAESCRELGMEDLDGNVKIVLDVAREVYSSHAAAPELPLDEVVVR